jgi:hypothetical protein
MNKFLKLGVLAGVACFGLTSCSSADDELIDANKAKEEAEKAINESNVEAEARKLMKEIESDY